MLRLDPVTVPTNSSGDGGGQTRCSQDFLLPVLHQHQSIYLPGDRYPRDWHKGRVPRKCRVPGGGAQIVAREWRETQMKVAVLFCCSFLVTVSLPLSLAVRILSVMLTLGTLSRPGKGLLCSSGHVRHGQERGFCLWGKVHVRMRVGVCQTQFPHTVHN